MGALQGRDKPKPFTRVQEYFRNKRNERKEKKRLKKEIKALRLKAKHGNVEEKIEKAFPTPKVASLGLNSKPDFELASLRPTLAEPESREVKNDRIFNFIKSSRRGHRAEEVTDECTQDDVEVEIPTLEDGQTVDLQVALEELDVADEEDETAEPHEELVPGEELKEVHDTKYETIASPPVTACARDNKEPKHHPLTSVADDKDEIPKVEESQSEYTLSQHTSLESTSLDVLSDEVEEPHVFEDSEMYPGREIISDYERYIPSVDWPHRPPSLSVTIDSRWSGYSSYCGHYDSSDTEYITSCTSSYDNDVFYDEEIVTGVQKISPRYERTGKSDTDSAQKRQPRPDTLSHARRIPVTSEKYSAHFQGSAEVSKNYAEVLKGASIVENNGSNSTRKRDRDKQTSTKPIAMPKSGYCPKDSSLSKTTKKGQIQSIKRVFTKELMPCKDKRAVVQMKNKLGFKKSSSTSKLHKPKIPKTIKIADRSRKYSETTTIRQKLQIDMAKASNRNGIKSTVHSHKGIIEVVKPKLSALKYRLKNAPVSFSKRKLPQSKGPAAIVANPMTKETNISLSSGPPFKGPNISNSGRSDLAKCTSSAVLSPYSSLQLRRTTSHGTAERRAPVMFPQPEHCSSARRNKVRPLVVPGHSVRSLKLPALKGSLRKKDPHGTADRPKRDECSDQRSTKVIPKRELKLSRILKKRLPPPGPF